MLMDKKELRTLIAQNKKETSRAAILDLSGPILRRLAVHPRFIAARTVLLYHSLPDEVDTQDFVRYWSLRKCILLPTVKGKDIELLVNYEPQLHYVGEWWKQLYGESEGKDGKGILPDSVCNSTDHHSLGQFVQDGKKILFETNLYVEKPMIDLTFPSDDENLDNMNYLAGKSIDWVNKMAAKGTLQAHEETGGVPNIIITMPDMSAYSFGNMCMFYFKAIAMTTLMNDSNPFNQPGVEVYKKNMFKLLGKE